MSKFLQVFSPLAIGMILLCMTGCTSSRSTSRSIEKIADWFETENRESGAGDPTTVAILAGPQQSHLLPPKSAAIGDPVPLGSVTKVLTALMTLKGAQSGLFDLDDPVIGVDHSTGEGVTWRQLLEHRAGYVDRRVDPTSLEASIPVVPPGVLHLYSNEGYVVLARALESASGKSFPELAQTLVFAPLKMSEIDFEVRAQNDPWSPSLGASGLIASPVAFAPLVEAVAAQDLRLLTRDGWNELFELELWESVILDGRSALIQEGRVTGRRSALLVFPQRRSALLVSYDEQSEQPVDSMIPGQADRLQRRTIEDLGEKYNSPGLWGLTLPPWISGRPTCTACDWTVRWGFYRSDMTGETLIIEDQNGGPILIEESGETLAVGPQLSDGRTTFHDLYKPITDVAEDEMLQTWPRRSGLKDTIEFGSRDGRIVGFLRGAQWYSKIEP